MHRFRWKLRTIKHTQLGAEFCGSNVDIRCILKNVGRYPRRALHAEIHKHLRWISADIWNSLKLRWILHRIQEPFSMHSVIDGQEPQNMLYSSLITHFLQIGKIIQKSVPSGDPKVIFLGPCRLQGNLWVDCLGLPGAPETTFLRPGRLRGRCIVKVWKNVKIWSEIRAGAVKMMDFRVPKWWLFDAPEPRNTLYSSLITHFSHFRKKSKNGHSRGTQK